MRIFSIDDFVQGKLPQKDDFLKALKLFEELAVLPFLKSVSENVPEVSGTLNYGSSNRKDFNIASDIDYLMAITSQDHFDVIRDASEQVLEKYNISLQPRVIIVGDTELNLDNLEPGFRQSLELAVLKINNKNNHNGKYRIKGQNPLELLPKSNQDLESALRQTVNHYLRRITKVMVSYPTSQDEDLKFLKDIMEKPFHVMRAAIQSFYQTLTVGGVDKFEDTKEVLYGIYCQTFSNQSLIDNITNIFSTTKKYVALLDERMSGKEFGSSEIHDISIRYTQMLSEIWERRHDVYNFTRGNALMMQKQ